MDSASDRLSPSDLEVVERLRALGRERLAQAQARRDRCHRELLLALLALADDAPPPVATRRVDHAFSLPVGAAAHPPS